jgi:hypothetical protein
MKMFSESRAIIQSTLLIRFVIKIVKIPMHTLISAFGQRKVLKKQYKRYLTDGA